VTIIFVAWEFECICKHTSGNYYFCDRNNKPPVKTTIPFLIFLQVSPACQVQLHACVVIGLPGPTSPLPCKNAKNIRIWILELYGIECTIIHSNDVTTS